MRKKTSFSFDLTLLGLIALGDIGLIVYTIRNLYVKRISPGFHSPLLYLLPCIALGCAFLLRAALVLISINSCSNTEEQAPSDEVPPGSLSYSIALLIYGAAFLLVSIGGETVYLNLVTK
jgi:hypothetical protein